jgi:hypothetical protein
MFDILTTKNKDLLGIPLMGIPSNATIPPDLIGSGYPRGDFDE